MKKNQQFVATGVASEENEVEPEVKVSAAELALLKEVMELRAKIKKEGDDQTPHERGVVVTGPSKNFPGEKRYDIRIEMQENEAQDVKVGVNGIVFQIFRGITVTVPACVVGVLRDAIADKLIQIPDPPNPPKNEWHKVGAVPMQILRGPY
jgi:hypothetical protein